MRIMTIVAAISMLIGTSGAELWADVPVSKREICTGSSTSVRLPTSHEIAEISDRKQRETAEQLARRLARARDLCARRDSRSQQMLARDMRLMQVDLEVLARGATAAAQRSCTEERDACREVHPKGGGCGIQFAACLISKVRRPKDSVATQSFQIQ